MTHLTTANNLFTLHYPGEKRRGVERREEGYDKGVTLKICPMSDVTY